MVSAISYRPPIRRNFVTTHFDSRAGGYMQGARLIIEIDGDGQFTLQRISYQNRGETPPSTWTSPDPPTWAQIAIAQVFFPIATRSAVPRNLHYHAELLLVGHLDRTSWPGSGISIDIERGLVTVTLNRAGRSTTLVSHARPMVENGENIPHRILITGLLQPPHVSGGG